MRGRERHTQVLNRDIPISKHARVLGQDAHAVLDDALALRVHDGDAVVVPRARRARNDALRLLDRRARANLNVRGLVAEGLLARCSWRQLTVPLLACACACAQTGNLVRKGRKGG